MKELYRKLRRLGIDLAPLGLAAGREDSYPYFCTPKNADIFGWSGVDGIHFCFARGFGETVFAVSPMNGTGERLHVIANNFEDFLRLLLACGDAAALEQAWQWDAAQFAAFLDVHPPTPEQQAVLNQLRDRLGLTPMPNPYAFIHETQAEFDLTRVRREDEELEAELEAPPVRKVPAWKVYYEGNFWGGHGRPGRECPVNVRFSWQGRACRVPSCYLCGKGLVLDLCTRAPGREMRDFLDKWEPVLEAQGGEPRPEQREQVEAEQPLRLNTRAMLTLNGKEVRSSHGSGLVWNPESHDDGETRAAVEHYGLAPEDGWAIARFCFPWPGGRRPQLRALSLTLSEEPRFAPGPRFAPERPGETVCFPHPATGKAHTLTVQKIEREAYSFAQDGWEVPSSFVTLSYTIDPPLPAGEVELRDCCGGDAARPAVCDPMGPDAAGTACIGIIGGADGPTALGFARQEEKPPVQYAVSSAYFDPPERVTWHLLLRLPAPPEQTVVLPIPE